jgi:hypothetical protein
MIQVVDIRMRRLQYARAKVIVVVDVMLLARCS